MSFVKIGCCIADRGGMLGQTKAAGSACTTARQIVKGMPNLSMEQKLTKKRWLEWKKVSLVQFSAISPFILISHGTGET